MRAILRRGRASIAREFSRALHSLPRSSVCDSDLEMSIDMRATFISLLFLRRLTDRKFSRFLTAPLSDFQSRVKFFREKLLPAQSSQCRDSPPEISRSRETLSPIGCELKEDQHATRRRTRAPARLIWRTTVVHQNRSFGRQSRCRPAAQDREIFLGEMKDLERRTRARL